MIRKCVARMGVVLCVLGTPHLVHSGGVDGGLRLAILAGEGERAPAAETIVLLEVAASQQPGMVLVERAEIDKILKEQELTVSGLVDRATAVKVGKLLAADLFLFVEKIPGTDPTTYQARVIEARTGVALAAELVEEKVVVEDQSALLGLMARATAKAQVPLAKRHHLALLDFRNEEPNWSLEGLAKALGMFLLADLARVPSVVVLERESLEQFSKEEGLTGLELQLKTSAILLEAGLKRAAEPGSLAVAVNLCPAAGGEARRVTVTVPEDDLPAARRRIVEALATELATRPPGARQVDRHTESGKYARQAWALLDSHRYEAAVRAAEAAYALDVNDSTLCVAGKAWSALSAELAPTQKKRLYRAQLRANELALEVYRRFMRNYEDGKVGNVDLPITCGGQGCRFVPVSPKELEAAKLRDEFVRLKERVIRLRLTHYRKHYGPAQGLYWIELQRLLYFAQTLPAGAERRRAILMGVVQAVAEPPGEDPSRHDVLEGLVEARGKRSDPDEHAAICKVLVKSSDPVMRFFGLRGLAWMAPDQEAAVRATLDAFFREMPLEYLDRRFHRIRIALDDSFWRLAGRHPEKLAQYFREIVHPWVRKGDATRLRTWRYALQEHFDRARRSRRGGGVVLWRCREDNRSS